MINQNNFTTDDIKKYKQFNETVAKYAKWEQMSTQELAQVFHCLAWFAGIQAKIEANIIEVTAVKQFRPLEPIPENASELGA